MAKKSSPEFLAGFGKRLRSARIVAGFPSARGFADKVHQKPQTYRKYERGESEPTLEALAEMAQVARCSIDVLLTKKPYTDPSIREAKTNQRVIGRAN